MASYHLSVKPVSRKAGRSATGAAAYRAADRIRDERTGELWDFRRKRGVEYREIVLPANAPEWAGYRASLWNAAEAAERRKNSTVAREFEVALPSELSPGERQELAVRFARELVGRHGFAADVCLHKAGRGGDRRNHHAHILCSTRRLTPSGFEAKTRELDDLKTGPDEVTRWRARWAELQNELLAEHGHAARVDHRSLEAQGLDREPTRHKGPAITALERRGLEAHVGRRLSEEQRLEAQARLERAAERGRLEREGRELKASIIDVSGDIAAAKRERDQVRARSPVRNLEELQKEGREKWLAMRAERQAKEGTPEQGRSPEEEQKRSVERWLEYRRNQEIGKGRAPEKSQEREGPEKGRDRGKEHDGPELE